MKYQPKTKPFGHQGNASLRAARARNYAIFFEPRLGKSKAALDYVGLLALAGHVKKVAIIAPRIAIPIWEQQIDQHFPYAYRAESFDEEWKDSNLPYVASKKSVKFFLAGREETFRRTRTKKGYQRPKQDILEAWRPDVIILDESHEYKRPGGVGAQDCWRLVRRLRSKSSEGKPWVVLLSGTPNPKGWVDLFAQFRIMDDTIFGTSFDTFKNKYVVYGQGKRRWKIIQYNHVKRLERKVRDHSVSVNAEAAGLANVQSFQTLPAKLPPRVVKMYLEMVEEFITEWEKGVLSATNAGVRRIRLLQITGGFTTEGEKIHDAKLEVLRAYGKLLLEQEESVVVYCRFTAEVEAATEAIASLGYRTHRVDGSTSREDRTRAIHALRSPPKTPTAIVFQHQAGSRAIELVGAAETVYYSAPDGWVDYFQTMKRTQGPNQPRPVRYSHIVVPGTVDIATIRGLQEKEDWHAELMQNPRRYLTGL